MGSSPQAQAVARADAEWRAWPTLSANDRADARARYIRDGAGDAPAPGYQWCGAFVGDAYKDLVHKALRFALMQSTVRLWILGSCGTDKNLWPSDGVVLPDGTKTTARALHASTGDLRVWVHGAACLTAAIEPGDILCVRNNRKKDPPAGGHVVLAVEVCSPEQSSVVTISGNGLGKHADGSTGNGVVRNEYPRSEIRQILRLSAHDFDHALKYDGGR